MRKIRLEMLNLDGECIRDIVEEELRKLIVYAVDAVELMVLHRLTADGIEVTYDNGYCGDANRRWTETDDWQSLVDHSLEHDTKETRADIAQKLMECAFKISPELKNN